MAITAQDLYNYTKCYHRVYLDNNGDPAERSEVNEFVKMLWEMGLQKELEHLAGLKDIPYEDLKALTIDQAIVKTRALMEQGVPLIYQGAIQVEDWLGRPDLLVRHDDAVSRFGDYYYEAIDIKAGRGWEERDGKKTRFKSHYAYQVMFYRDILDRIQGCAVPVSRIINVDNEIEEFDPQDFEEEYRQALQSVAKLVIGAEASEPVLSSACALCEWYQKCRRWVEATRDPSGLFFVGKLKFALKERGLETIADIAKINVKDFVSGANKIPRIGEKSLERMKRRAEVMLSGKPEIRAGYAFPQQGDDIYFDIEDDPTQGVVYFFGLVTRGRNGSDEFLYFMADSPEEEEVTVRSFWDFLKEHGDANYYVYSHKERTTLRMLMARYNLERAVFDNYVEHELDLYKLVVDYSDWPTYSYGIKQIARQTGFNWRDIDPGGANSIAWYNNYIKDPSRKDILQRILEYNEDDCRAMIAVKEYFERRA